MCILSFKLAFNFLKLYKTKRCVTITSNNDEIDGEIKKERKERKTENGMKLKENIIDIKQCIGIGNLTKYVSRGDKS